MEWEVLLFLFIYTITTFLLSMKLLYYYSNPDDSKYYLGIVAKGISLIAIQLGWTILALTPTDAYSSRNDSGINMKIFWQCIFIITFLWLILMIPYAMEYIDAEDDDKLPPYIKAFQPACIVAILCLLGSFLLFFILRRTPISETCDTLSNTSHDNLSKKEGRMCSNLGKKTPLVLTPCIFLCLVSWILIFPFLGGGLVMLPFQRFYKFYKRPRKISEEKYRHSMIEFGKEVGEVKHIAETFRERDEKISQMYRSFKKVKEKQKYKIDFNMLRQIVHLLEKEKESMLTSCYMKNDHFYLPYIDLILAVFFTLLSLAWFVHITLNILFPHIVLNKPYSFLVYLFKFLKHRNIFILDLLVYVLLVGYLLLCVVSGWISFNRRAFFFSAVHPIQPGKTYLNSIIFNAALLCVSSCCTPQLTQAAFPEYTLNTYNIVIYKDNLNEFLVFGFLFKYNICIWGTVLFSIITIMFLCFKRKEQKSSHLIKEMKEKLMEKHEEKTQETKNTLDTKVDDMVKTAGASVKVLNFMDVITTNGINTNESTDFSHIKQKCHQLGVAVFLLIESLCRTMYVFVELLIFMISKVSPKLIKWTRMALVYGSTSCWKVLLLFWHSSLLLKYCVAIITLLSIFIKIFYAYRIHIQFYESYSNLTRKTKQCYYGLKRFLFRLYSRMVSFAIECKTTIVPFILFLSLPFFVNDYHKYSILNTCHVFAPVTFCCIVLLRYCSLKNNIEQTQHSKAQSLTTLPSNLDVDKKLHDFLDTTLQESHASTKKKTFMSVRAISHCVDYWISMIFTHLFFKTLFTIFKNIIIPSCLTGCGIPSYALVDRHCSIQFLHLKKYSTRWSWIQLILCRNFKKSFFFLHDACYALLLILLLTIQSKRLTRLRQFLCSLFDNLLFFITGTHFSLFGNTSDATNLNVKKIIPHLPSSNPNHGVLVSMLRYVMSALPDRINFLLQFLFHIPQLLLLCLPSFLLPLVILSFKTFYPAMASLQSLSQKDITVQAYWISYFVLLHICQYISSEYIPFSSLWVYVPFKNHMTLIWLIFLQVICLNGIPLHFLSSLCISSSYPRPKTQQAFSSNLIKATKPAAISSSDMSSPNTNDKSNVSSAMSDTNFQKTRHYSRLNTTKNHTNTCISPNNFFSLFNTDFKAKDSRKSFDPDCTDLFIPPTLPNSVSSSFLDSPTCSTKKTTTCRLKKLKKKGQRKNVSLH